MSKEKGKEDPKFLTREFVLEHRCELETAVRAKLAGWGAHGWRIIRRHPFLCAKSSCSRPSPVRFARSRRSASPGARSSLRSMLLMPICAASV
jgi:hypothetical protein